MNTKFFWQLLMLGAIGLWILSLLAGYLLFPESHLKAWGLFIGLIIIHASELLIALKIGKTSEISPQAVVLKTMLFGFTWWVPFKKGILDK
jgi:hypothetical protein